MPEMSPHVRSFAATASIDELREMVLRQGESLTEKSAQVVALHRELNLERHRHATEVDALVEHARIHGYPLAEGEVTERAQRAADLAAHQMRYADAAEAFRATLCGWPIQAKVRQDAAAAGGFRSVDPELLAMLLRAIERANKRFTKAISGPVVSHNVARPLNTAERG